MQHTVRDARRTWTDIAPAFDRTRQRPWSDVLAWADARLPREGRVLDLACGNGRHGARMTRAGARVVGADFSRPLAGYARERGLEVALADAGHLPFVSRSFDGAVFVAALHNVPGRRGRLRVLTELARVLKPGARALVTVWARWQPGRVRYFLQELPHHVTGDADHAFGDVLVPWRGSDKAPERSRYYHFYSRFELREDLRVAGLDVDRIRAVRLKGTGVLADNLFAEVSVPG